MPEKLPLKTREISLIFGKTGMGKSNWLKVYLQSLKRVIILDPMDEYPAQEFIDPAEMFDFVAGRKEFKVKSCNVLHLGTLGEIVDSLADVTFLIEEAQRCLPASSSDLPESLQRIIFQGRHYLRSLLIAAQRPSIVHIAARSQWTRIVSFNVTETADVKWMKDQSGYPLDGSHPDFRYDIRKLPVGQYFEITPGSFDVKNAPLYHPRRKEEKSSEFVEFFMSLNPRL